MEGGRREPWRRVLQDLCQVKHRGRGGGLGELVAEKQQHGASVSHKQTNTWDVKKVTNVLLRKKNTNSSREQRQGFDTF